MKSQADNIGSEISVEEKKIDKKKKWSVTITKLLDVFNVNRNLFFCISPHMDTFN